MTARKPKPGPESNGFTSFVERFLESRGNKFRFTDGTRRFYANALPTLVRDLIAIGAENPNDITLRTVEALEVRLSQRVAPSTIAKNLRVLRTFLNWLHTNGLIAQVPVIKFKVPTTLVEPLSERQFETLLKVLRDTDGAKRDTAIVMLMGRAGLRLSEVLRLKVSDFQDNRLRLFQTKTGADRHIPLPPKVTKAVRTYLDSRPPSESANLFLTLRKAEPITDTAIEQMFYRLSADIGFKVYPHLLRHTFAFHGVKNRVPPSVIQFMLGHSTFDMTRKYIRLAAEDAADFISAWD